MNGWIEVRWIDRCALETSVKFFASLSSNLSTLLSDNLFIPIQQCDGWNEMR